MARSAAYDGIRPEFIIIGAEKAGTTTLHTVLDAHPEISMSDPKEPAFFCQDAIYARGWDWYRSFFANATGRVLGEATPAYSIEVDFPGTADRIASDLPEVKIVYIIRDPVERIESAWMWYRAHGRHKLNQRIFPPLAEAVRTVPGIVDGSKYWRQLSFYRQHFPDEQIHVMFLEELRSDRDRTLQGLYDFLGVDPLTAAALSPPAAAMNESAGQRMDTDFVVRLRSVAALEKVRARTPASIRGMAARVLKRKITNRPTWDRGALAWVREQVADDAAAMLSYANRPADFWPLGTGAHVG